MSNDFLPRDKQLITYSQNLRKNATPQEKHLWFDYLKKQTKQFNRQRIIGVYIVDFFCPTLNLVIEIDGSQHYEEVALEYDARRTEYFESLALKVIRLTNIDIDRNFNGVCEMLDEIIAGKSAVGA
jgi:very-short-patch-repair endonuclease